MRLTKILTFVIILTASGLALADAMWHLTVENCQSGRRVHEAGRFDKSTCSNWARDPSVQMNPAIRDLYLNQRRPFFNDNYLLPPAPPYLVNTDCYYHCPINIRQYQARTAFNDPRIWPPQYPPLYPRPLLGLPQTGPY